MLQKSEIFEKQLDIINFLPECQEILRDYLCPLCEGVYKDPIIDQCNHVFCRQCIEKSLKASKFCPLAPSVCIDEKKLNSIKFVVNILDKQTLYCLNKVKNCSWVGKLGMLNNHLLNECKKYLVNCNNPGCEIKVSREVLDNHKKSCDFRTVNCSECNVSVAHILLSFHMKECPKYTINCPGNCGEFIQRQNIDKHLKSECSSCSVECPYANYGCESILKRREISDHHRKNTETHNLLVLKFLESFEKNYVTRLNAIEKNIKDINDKISLLQDEKEDHEFEERKKRKRLVSQSNPKIEGELDNNIRNKSLTNREKTSQREIEHVDLISEGQIHNFKEKEGKNYYKIALKQEKTIFDTKNISRGLIIKGNKIICSSSTRNSHLYAFIDQKLDNDFSWQVTINNFTNWMALGVCDKDKVIKNDFKFVGDSPGFDHACFLLTSNSFLWNANYPIENKVNMKTLSNIKEGDIVKMNYNFKNKTLTFNNGFDSVTLNQVNKGNLTPCVIMMSNGDEVTVT